MQINPTTGRIVNMPNVDIKVPDFGGTSSVEFLGKLIPYLNRMVEFFVDRGYERGKDIRAAPYDWRLAAGRILTQLLQRTVSTRCNHDSSKTFILYYIYHRHCTTMQ